MSRSATTTEPSGEKSFASRIASNLLLRREAGIFAVAVVLVVYFQIANPAFLSAANIQTIAQSIPGTAIIAVGLVMVMILGEIDLSVGQAFSFSAIVMYIAYEQFFLVLPLAVVVGLVAAAVAGVINGALRVYFGVPSFVATLGTYFLLAGLNVILIGGFTRTAPGEGWVKEALGAAPYSGIIWCLVVVVVMHVLLTNTRWGMHTFATGGNFIGAKEAGIKVDRVRIGNFVMCSVLGGLAGVIDSFRINSIDPLSGGADILLYGIAAAVIGGTPLAGGVGTVVGAFLGAVVISILQNGFTLQGISANEFNVILGIAVLVVMVINIYFGRFRGRTS